MRFKFFTIFFLVTNSLFASPIEGKWQGFSVDKKYTLIIDKEVFSFSISDSNNNLKESVSLKIHDLVTVNNGKQINLFVEESKGNIGCFRFININGNKDFELVWDSGIWGKDRESVEKQVNEEKKELTGFIFFSERTLEKVKKRKNLSELSKNEFLAFGKASCSHISKQVQSYSFLTESPLAYFMNSLIIVAYKSGYNPTNFELSIINQLGAKHDLSKSDLNFEGCFQ
ncbi:hypothetical protein FUAX_53740 (plasmid) [Fulvitalea axinellae]|uniref:DUF4476 domain-containing protein n=1 Tax=Fulvitalea axinellae TaxID=1182444 RepID=A0AAU9CYV3_9BACT|nr:hypothetical protein FUAX_53740 [Fulvitalea axinellae]